MNLNWSIPAPEPRPILCLILFSVQDQTAHEAEALPVIGFGFLRNSAEKTNKFKAKEGISRFLYPASLVL